MAKAKKGLHDPKNPYHQPINPKDLVAQLKLDLSVVPETLETEVALAFYEGALKYGRFNWRMKPVKASVYLSALKRHIKKWESGEEVDKKTKVRHLAYAVCCISILMDARHYGSLIDDRAPRGKRNPDMSAYIDGTTKIIKHLQKLFAKETPHQYTIRDKE